MSSLKNNDLPRIDPEERADAPRAENVEEAITQAIDEGVDDEVEDIGIDAGAIADEVVDATDIQGIEGFQETADQIGSEATVTAEDKKNEIIDQKRSETVSLLSDEQRQTLLQKDLLDVLLRTEAGRILLGDIKQEEAKAREKMSILSGGPKEQMRQIKEVKYDMDAIKRQAFPQVQQMNFIRENRAFQKMK